jgi:hypothetical protein
MRPGPPGGRRFRDPHAGAGRGVPLPLRLRVPSVAPASWRIRPSSAATASGRRAAGPRSSGSSPSATSSASTRGGRSPSSSRPGRRFLSSFVRDDAGILDQAKPVAARGGLLLVRVSHRPRDKITVLRLCVCDLLAGKRDLPPLDVAPFGDEGVRGYAVLTAADHGAGHHQPADGYSTFFQVLLTGVDHEDGRAFILKFSSAAAASRSWSCIQGSLAGPYGSRVAAVTRGTARWLFHGNSSSPNGPSLYTIDVGVGIGSVSATKLPLDMLPRIMRVDRSNVWLCLSTDERLSLIYLHNNHLWILTKKDGDLGGTGNWMCTRAVQVGVELGLFGMESLSMVSVGEKSGTVLASFGS